MFYRGDGKNHLNIDPFTAKNGVYCLKTNNYEDIILISPWMEQVDLTVLTMVPKFSIFF